MKSFPCLVAVAALSGAAAAMAHDSWFEQRPAPPGQLLLALGTGNRFPALETAIAAPYLAAQGCTGRNGPLALTASRNDERSLLLKAPRSALSCWVQLVPLDVTVADDKVPLYLDEIRAAPELRARWADMRARGLPWRERYVKHARVDLGTDSGTDSEASTPSTEPVLGMDLRLERVPGSALRVGGSVAARVLRDGQPLAGQALELRSELSPLGIWRRSDAQGRVVLPLPLAGHWLLRGVDLRPHPERADEWVSRFVTLAFEVLPRDPPGAPVQNSSSLTSSARSASQTAASSAISSEPPTSTPRR